MKTTRSELIQSLARDLHPVRPPLSPLLAAACWLAGTWVFVVSVTLLIAPLRPGALLQASTHGRFLAESLVGLAGSVLIAGYVFADSVPGFARRVVLPVGLALAVVWVLAFVAGLGFPALEPSMVGKRAECYLETLVYGLPPTLAAIWISRRYFVLEPLRTAALSALAAGMVPALLMQFACMYDPAHILMFHILPVPLLVAVAVGVQWLLLRASSSRRDHRSSTAAGS
ncbi:MAG: NrsF family protein [Gammaproteobacteria bacterium]